MIEILKYHPSNKKDSILKGHFSISVEKWGNFIIEDMAYFEKDNKRWCAFPSKEYEMLGNKKFFPITKFKDKEMQNIFLSKVRDALDEYLKKPLSNLQSEMNI
jgi:hypothetical protein